MHFTFYIVFFLFSDIQSFSYNSRSDTRRFSPEQLNETWFPPIKSKLFGDVPEVSPKDYPWMARVVPTPASTLPVLCQASALQPRIFVTSARCIMGLSTALMRILFHEYTLELDATVVPSPEQASKQYFDDAAFLVTKAYHEINRWNKLTVKTIDMNRTDDEFKWFSNLKLDDKPFTHKILAYFTNKSEEGHHELRLRALDVGIGIRTCQRIFTRNGLLKGYFVPCAFSCTIEEYNKDKPKCAFKIGVDSAPVYDTKKKQLVGVSTWSGLDQKGRKILPVGIAILNSNNFWNDYECAIKIKDYTQVHPSKNQEEGLLQRICDT